MSEFDDAIRTVIRSEGMGCNGVKITFPDGQHQGCHIKRIAMPLELIQRLCHFMKYAISRVLYQGPSYFFRCRDASLITCLPNFFAYDEPHNFSFSDGHNVKGHDNQGTNTKDCEKIFCETVVYTAINNASHRQQQTLSNTGKRRPAQEDG